MKRTLPFVVLGALACAILTSSQPKPMHAAEFRSGFRVVVEEDEVVEGDLYVCAWEVGVDGTVKGDLIALSGQIAVNGSIEGDLITTGQTVVLAGSVGDDIRMAGQVLKLESGADVADDIIAAGFSLEADEETAIGGGVYYAGYQARFAGSVGKDILAAMADCELSGTVGGDVQVKVGSDEEAPTPPAFTLPPPVAIPEVAAGLTVTESAKIDGRLSYRSPAEGSIDETAEIAGGIEYKRVAATPRAKLTILQRAFPLVRRFACLAIIGICVLLVAPRWSQSLCESIKDRPLMSLGGGVLGMILFVVLMLVLLVLIVILAIVFGYITLGEMIPVVVIVGLVSLIGLSGGFWFFTFYVAQVIVSLALGQIVFLWGKTEQRILPFLLGLVVLVLLSGLPRADLITYWLTISFGFGGLVLWLAGLRNRGAEQAALPTA